MCAVTAVVTASGSALGSRLAGGARTGGDGRRAARGRARSRCSGRLRALRGAADRRGRRLVPHRRSRTSDDSTLYSIGRVAGWCVEPLADLPAADVPDRPARAAVSTARWSGSRSLVVLVLYLPTALLVEHVSGAAPWTTLRRQLPRQRVHGHRLASRPHRGPGAPAAGVRHDRALRGGRACGWRSASAARRRLMRRALAPVLAVACFRCAVFAAALLGAAARAGLRRRRRAAVAARPRGAADWRSRSSSASCAGGCSSRARRSGSRRGCTLTPTPEDLRRALAEAFDDPSLEIAYWLGDGEGHWGDAAGTRSIRPAAPGRAVTEIVRR